MPLMYRHWSFGKHFIHHERLYRKGVQGLAYEIVINSNPCISYCMEENTMPLQALVIAHAAFGHNHFFKNNHLFRQWTDPDGFLEYLNYARAYIQRCEERHGAVEVERLLDSAHALMPSSVFRHRRPPQPSGARTGARAAALRGGGAVSELPLGRHADGAADAPRRGRSTRTAPHDAPAGGEPALFHRELLAYAEALAAAGAPDRSQHLAVFLPAEADPGDERGLRLLRALGDPQPPARGAAASTTARCSRCCITTATSSPSPITTTGATAASIHTRSASR
jgi:hypothetical protein